MLVLIDGDLAQRWSLRGLQSAAAVHIGTRRGDRETTWHPSGDDVPDRELISLLPEVLQPVQATVVLLFWSAPDTHLEEVLNVLERARGDYPVEVVLVLAGPIDPRIFSSDAFHKRGDWLRSVLFIGRCDNTGRTVTEAERRTIFLALLHLIDAPPENRATVVQRLHWLGLIPLNAEEWTPVRPFAAVGCEFLGRNRHDLIDVARGYIHAVFAEELRRGLASTSKSEDLARVPESLLQALQSFRAGRRISNDTDPVRTFEAELPPPPSGPFAGWSCPWIRQPASAEGDARLRLARLEIFRHREALLSSLGAITSAVRENGRAIGRTAQERIIEPLRGSSLADLAVFLRTYFPAFSRLRGRATRSKTPCVPASDPGRPQCAERSQTMESHFADVVTRLPSWSMVVVVAIATVLLITAGGYGVRRDWDARVWVGLIAAAILLQGAFWWHARRQARQVAGAMLDDWEEVMTWLQRTFEMKVRWVVDKTYLMLEEEVIAHAETIGRKLDGRLDRFLADWRDLLETPSTSDSAASILKSFEVDEDDLRDYRERVLGFHRALIENLGDVAGEQATGRALAEALQTIGDGLFQRIQDKPIPIDQIEDVLKTWSTTLTAPPLLARTSEKPQSALHRAIILPTKYGMPLDTTAMAALAVPPQVNSARITGPMAWSLKRGMTHKEAVRALEVPHIPTA